MSPGAQSLKQSLLPKHPAFQMQTDLFWERFAKHIDRSPFDIHDWSSAVLRVLEEIPTGSAITDVTPDRALAYVECAAEGPHLGLLSLDALVQHYLKTEGLRPTE